MKVLFVSSGNFENNDIAPFIKSQGDALIQHGIEIIFLPIRGKGLKGYFSSSKKLKKYLRDNQFDIIHAHYVLSGWTCILSGTRIPIVISLMGSDAYGDYTGRDYVALSSRYLTLLTLLIQPFVSSIISKSENIQKYVYRKKISHIIPNGIQLGKFLYTPQGFRDELGFNEKKKYVLFLGDKNNPRKNFQLVLDAMKLLNNPNLELLAPYPVSHDQVCKYLNSVDILLHTSFMEGSPNIIKEAMACNCPIVATNVGDIAWLFGDEPGHFLISFNPKEVAVKIEKALAFGKRTNGRQRIIDLGLDSKTIAQRIIQVYHKTLKISV